MQSPSATVLVTRTKCDASANLNSKTLSASAGWMIVNPSACKIFVKTVGRQTLVTAPFY